MKHFLIIYCTIGFVYGWYAVLQMYVRYYKFATTFHYTYGYFLNLVIWPISIIYAIFVKTFYSKNLIEALKDQGPFKRAFRNFFITRNAWGLFHINSHINQTTGKEKVMYNTKQTALKSAKTMGKKNNTHFSAYKCVFCDGYHIGKNRDNK